MKIFNKSKLMLLQLLFLFIFINLGFGQQNLSECENSAKCIDQKNPIYEINENGELIGQCPCPKSFYKKDCKITVIVKNSSSQNYIFEKEQIEEKIDVSSIPIYKGPDISDVKVTPVKHTFNFTLLKRGVKYRLKIVRYDNEKLALQKKDGAVIFNKTFQTYQKYHVGLTAGLWFPLVKSDEFEIGYEEPDDPIPSIIKDRVYEAKTLFFISIYPWGFEPDKPDKKPIFNWGNVHINFGSEISESIFKKWYLGVGYSFKYFSLSLLVSYGRVAVLRSGFSEGRLQTTTDKEGKEVPIVGMDSAPVDHRYDFILGFSLSFPINIATGIFSKIFGIN